MLQYDFYQAKLNGDEIVFFSCRKNLGNVIRIQKIPLFSYYSVDTETNVLLCYGPYTNYVAAYSLAAKKLWEKTPEELAANHHSFCFNYQSFDGKILLPVKNQKLDRVSELELGLSSSDIWVTDIFSGEFLYKLNLNGYVFSTIIDGDYVYASGVLSISKNTESILTDKNYTEEFSIVKINPRTKHIDVILTLPLESISLAGMQLAIYKDLLLLNLYNGTDDTKQLSGYCLYALDKNTGTVLWKRENIVSNFEVDKEEYCVYFVDQNFSLLRKNIFTEKENKIVQLDEDKIYEKMYDIKDFKLVLKDKVL